MASLLCPSPATVTALQQPPAAHPLRLPASLLDRAPHVEERNGFRRAAPERLIGRPMLPETPELRRKLTHGNAAELLGLGVA